MDWKKPTTQLLGRFQPWHEGHTELFRRAVSHTGQVIILLRKADGGVKNPYTFEERKFLITEALKKENYEYGKEFEIVEVPNIVHFTYGRDVGYTIMQEILPKHLEKISATEIRNRERAEQGLLT
tara:strand:- start:77 stop:451 length:375 start_codon:yes stop_codon:yes gene_type:complete